VVFMVVMLLFPTSQSTTAETMNYAIVLVMAVFVFASVSWVLSARKWFTGPISNIDSHSESTSYDEKQEDDVL